MGKKNASRRRSNKRHRRAVDRRRKARARKAAPRPERMVMLTMGGPGVHHDDCAHCRAKEELGIVDGTPITAERYEAYRARVEELAAEGVDRGESVSIDALMRKHDWINDRLRERGEYHELDAMHAMDDARFAAHMRQVHELGDAYDRLN